ncbi:MAG: hypothetical protein JWR51_3316 [Devosia sp.]|uniref:ATP-binding protein n=1 Tax=Devosia sp. TaxID=1871048 RepID=UPI00261E29CF|nr:ATP-binding protein [Devosia sp.]MDB5530213.1 hypothetical protein [Devosia sp.]
MALDELVSNVAEAGDEATKVEMAGWDIDRRLRRIQKIYILHPGVRTAWQQLESTWKYGMRLRETSTAYITATSRCGKTETVKQFVKEKTGRMIPNERVRSSVLVEGNGHRVLFLDCTNGATPRQAAKSILDTHFLPVPRISETEASEKLIFHMGANKVDMFIIDEAQKMTKGGTGQGAEDFANWLLTLENSRKFRIVVTGGPALRELMNSHPTIRDRKDSFVHIAPFAHRTAADRDAFRTFLSEVDLRMPFIGTPLGDARHDDAFFYATRGRPGMLSKLLEKATVAAFEVDEDVIPSVLQVQDLARACEVLMREEDRMLGINPFSHSGPLPSIPRSLAEETVHSRDLPPDVRTPKRRGSRISKRPG